MHNQNPAAQRKGSGKNFRNLVFQFPHGTVSLRDSADLPKLRKSDERMALIAHILMEQTSVRQKWIFETLHMGSAPYVSRLAKSMGERWLEIRRLTRSRFQFLR